MLIIIALKTSSFQTWLAEKATEYLSEELGTKVRIKKVDVEFIDRMRFEGVYIEDQKGDTLLYAPVIKARVLDYSLSKEKAHVDRIELIKPRIKTRVYEGSTEMNFDFLVDYFSSDEDTTSGGWEITITNIILDNGVVSFRDENEDLLTYGFDPANIHSKISCHIRDIKELESETVIGLNYLMMKDRSGFHLKNLSGGVHILSGGFAIDKMKLRTASSYLLSDRFEMIGNSWDAFNEFMTQVKIKTTFKKGTYVNLKDVAFFTEELKGAKQKLEITGEVKGTVNNLKSTDLWIKFQENSFLRGSFDLSGLPNIEETFMAFNIDKLKTNSQDLSRIELPPYNDSVFIELPDNFRKLGELNLKGSFLGFFNDFVAYADLNTDIGSLSSEMEFLVPEGDKQFAYKGKLDAFSFNIGYLYEIPDMGRVSANISIDTGYGLDVESLYASVSGDVTSLDFNSYRYSNIKIKKGTFEKDYFLGELDVIDPAVNLDFNGKIDFSKKLPRYDFIANINNAHLSDLNFADKNSDAALCATIVVDSTRGDDLDNFNGDIKIRNISYHEYGKDIVINEIEILTTQSGENKSLDIISDIADIQIYGDYSFYNLEHSFMKMASSIMPALIPPDEEKYALMRDDIFDYQIYVKDISAVTEIFELPLSMTPGTTLYGRYNSAYDEIQLEGFSEMIMWEDMFVKNMQLRGDKFEDIMLLDLSASHLYVQDSLEMYNMVVGLTPWHDNVEVSLAWNNSEQAQGKLKGTLYFYDNDHFEFDFAPSELDLMKHTWYINDLASIHFLGDAINVCDFNFKTDDGQSITLGGTVSSIPEDTLGVAFENFDVHTLQPLLADEGMKIYGKLHGNARLSNLYDELRFISDLKIDSLKINKSYVGNVDFISMWQSDKQAMDLSGTIDRIGYRALDFRGYYYTQREEESIDFTVNLEELDLGVVNEFLPEDDISDFHAYTSGNIFIKGTPAEPKLSGKLSFIDGQVLIKYLNSKYFFSGDVTITEDMIAIDYIPVSDEETYLLDLPSNGNITGTFVHENFDPETFSYDINMEFSKMMLMNTDYSMNPLFYGQVFASGIVNIFGYDGKIEINADNSMTEKGTKFYLPLYGADEIVLQDYVRFISHDSATVDAYKLDLEDITMHVDLEVTDDAEVQIIFDPTIGDIMTGRAQGNISFDITELGDFEMYGNLEVVEGEYLFTMYNVINKRFEIEKGGTIQWLGDPYEALVDINTIYKTKAPTYNLVHMDDEKYRKKTDVQCLMNLKNDLYNPDLSFDIRVPKGDNNVDAALSRVRADQEELTKQFFSLLVINNFVSSQSSGYGSAALNATTADLLNNQLSNWLSQLSDEVDIGFQYSPGDNLTQKELALAFETQLLNDKLVLSGNFGVSQSAASAAQENSHLIGDFKVEYKINEDGTFRIKGFNETNDYNIVDAQQARYTQGVGLSYSEDFDKFSDLKFVKWLKRVFGKKKNKPQPAEKPED